MRFITIMYQGVLKQTVAASIPLLVGTSLMASTLLDTDHEIQSDQVRISQRAESDLRWTEGSVLLQNGIAEVHSSPQGFRYLGSKDAARVLEVWGNPNADGTLGMLFPAGLSPFNADSWGIVITYEESGHVSDEDTNKISYEKLLKEMQQAAHASNEERKKQGVPMVELVGWATPPRYDSLSHKLYWSKELQFEDSPETTLNYNIRVLGRKGVLILNAVASMQQLDLVERQTPALLASINFTEGNRYEDYKPGVDKLAAYGLTGLIAGGFAAKVVAKAGLLKLLLGFLIAGKKFVAVGVVALLAFLRSFFKKKKAASSV